VAIWVKHTPPGILVNNNYFFVRVGVASGPAVAGVIGQRKFAYDLWGDMANLASRLRLHGQPGRILVSESVVARLQARYAFGPRLVVELKGRGPTPAQFLLPRDGPLDARRPPLGVRPRSTVNVARASASRSRSTFGGSG